MIDKKLPIIVVRCLIYIYEKQYACVRWGGTRSSSFDITNGTRQGSVLSPAAFGVYFDDLLKSLRKLGFGCHIAGKFFGAALFADDLILMSPTRSGMQEMLSHCEKYGTEHNIVFSTDPNPIKSKSKCLYMNGKKNNVTYPAPVKLYGKPLPFVHDAVHLGNYLCEDVKTEHDAHLKRITFIDKSTSIREMFGFADPTNILQAIQLYAGSAYGSTQWDLYGEKAGQYYRTWNTAVKLTWQVPRECHTYIVENLLATEFKSFATRIKTSYVNFFKRLLNSRSDEVRLLAQLTGRDATSTTGRNLRNIHLETGLDPWSSPSYQIGDKLSQLVAPVPPQDLWRLEYLQKLLIKRYDMEVDVQETKNITKLIDSLCIN